MYGWSIGNKPKGFGIVLVIICIFLSAANAFEWEEEIRLSEADDHMSSISDIEAYEDNIYVVWAESMEEQYEAYLRRSPDNGETWLSGEWLTENDGYDSRSASIAVYEDNIHLVWVDTRNVDSLHPDPDIYYKRSLDNGETWSTDEKLASEVSFGLYGSPQIKAWEDNVFVMWCGYKDGFKLSYRRSTSNGLDWEDETMLTGPGYAYQTSSSLATWENYVYVAWIDYSQSCVRFKISEDWGSSWVETKKVDDLTGNAYMYGASVAVWEENVHIGWYDNRDNEREVYYDCSYDNGKSWDVDKKLTTRPEGYSRYLNHGPRLAAWGDYVIAILHCSFYRDYWGEELKYCFSANNGQTWCDAAEFTPDDSFNSQSPKIAVSQGNVHTVWWDGRHGHAEVYYKRGKIESGVAGSPSSDLKGYSLEVFSSRQTVGYTIPKRTKVNLSFYDGSGRAVRTLVSETKNAGYHQVDWDGCDDQGSLLPAGIYFCRLRAERFSVTRKVLILR
ncbi:hypothetical protein JXM67_15155 [candidate division WOR-3 bacterium]|nr:hypothetical protein [candidate division WOR-3 bacterium]